MNGNEIIDSFRQQYWATAIARLCDDWDVLRLCQEHLRLVNVECPK